MVLLVLNKAIWNTDTILHDTAYFRAMKNTSQTFNQAYGYLWWLNGKSSYLGPGVTTPYAGALAPNAPADMFCALGKDDQKIYIIPSQNMVIVRMGDSAGDSSSQAFSPFDNELWGKIDSLGICANAGITNYTIHESNFDVYPNPSSTDLNLVLTPSSNDKVIRIVNTLGEICFTTKIKSSIKNYVVDVSNLPKGIYFVSVGISTKKIIIQ